MDSLNWVRLDLKGAALNECIVRAGDTAGDTPRVVGTLEDCVDACTWILVLMLALACGNACTWTLALVDP